MQKHAVLGVLIGALSMFSNATIGQQTISIDANRALTLSVENGQAYSWGYPLGSALANRFRPTPLLLPAGPTSVSAAEGYALFLLPNGQVWSAGINAAGQLGLGVASAGPVQFSPAPAALVPLAAGIEAGLGGAYAWTGNGTLYGWGLLVAQLAPSVINVPNPVVSVSAGLMTLALDSLGQVWVWGEVFPGAAPVLVPQQLLGLPSVASVEVSETNALVLSSSGDVYQLDFSTSLGAAGFAQPNVTQVTGLPPIRSVAASRFYGACLDFSGNVHVFGNPPPVNGYISGPYVVGPPPGLNALQIGSLQNITEIAADRAIYARDISGDLWVLGEADYDGGLGLGNPEAAAALAARVPMNGPVPVTFSTTNLQATSGLCADQYYALSRPTFPAIGGEIAVSAIGPAGALLFAAPGLATAPQLLSPVCALFLDLPGLTAFLAAGIGPFPPSRAIVGGVQTLYEWVFPIPNLPTLAGFTVTAQVAWPAPTSALGFAMSAAQSFTIN